MMPSREKYTLTSMQSLSDCCWANFLLAVPAVILCATSSLLYHRSGGLGSQHSFLQNHSNLGDPRLGGGQDVSLGLTTQALEQQDSFTSIFESIVCLDSSSNKKKKSKLLIFPVQ